MISQILNTEPTTKEVPTKGTNTLLCVNEQGAMKATASIFSGKPRKKMHNYCGCGICEECRDIERYNSGEGFVDCVDVNVHITSYNPSTGGCNTTIRLPSLDHYKALVEFFSQAKLEAAAPAAKAA